MLEIKGLEKSFGNLEVLKNVDVTFEAGKVSCLIGPSGSGKSTLLRCINHLEVPDRGTITWRGELIGYEPKQDGRLMEKSDRHLQDDRRKIGMVFQHFNLFQNMTAIENITLGLREVLKMNKTDARDRAIQTLEEVGLREKADVYPRKLSGGQQQRVGIARALAMNPEVILFDEPTSALDPELVGDVLEVMHRIANEGMTMIVVTHELGFAREVGHSLVFMDEGQVLAQGDPEDMIKNPRTERIATFVSRVRK